MVSNSPAHLVTDSITGKDEFLDDRYIPASIASENKRRLNVDYSSTVPYYLGVLKGLQLKALDSHVLREYPVITVLWLY